MSHQDPVIGTAVSAVATEFYFSSSNYRRKRILTNLFLSTFIHFKFFASKKKIQRFTYNKWQNLTGTIGLRYHY
jgi:hypothetical protein